MNVEYQKLGDVLASIEDQPLTGMIFVEGDYPWDSETRCLVFSAPEEEQPQILDDFGQKMGLRRTLVVADVLQIFYHAHHYVASPSRKQLVDSFNYYFKHDAFLPLAPEE